MWFVLELKNYLDATKDIELINSAKEKVYRLVKYFSQFLNKDGLLENLTGWVFIEWSRCNDADCICGVNFPSNMLYSAMLKTIDELYGDEELRLQSEKIKAKIKELSFDGEFFEENAIRNDGKLSTTGILTETCQYYAFYFDVATKEEYP
jgi:alpha-L-rhamnosidase